MIISRTPFRISFFGGGTDYPAWYRRDGGAVLGTTINKYCYITCRYLPPFFEHRFRIVYSRSEEVLTVDEIAHPAVREVLRYLGIHQGVEIHHDGDLPARSGLGSSSAFTVGLLHALLALKGQMPNKARLAGDSIYIEHERIRETVGCQDQVLAAHGGFNHIVFRSDGDISVRPMTLPLERSRELNRHLMLFFTGIKRTASAVAQSYMRDFTTIERQLSLMRDMVDEGIEILTSGDDLSRFGRLLHESWVAKRSLSARVTNPQVETIYAEAMAAGALGGKLIGAGGGGFMLLFVRPEDQARVRARLGTLLHVPFLFEPHGSQIIFYDPEQDYSGEDRERQAQAIAAFCDVDLPNLTLGEPAS
jgi:D-glycero-alpha-D-manno-heptose-7-phosphate kinase